MTRRRRMEMEMEISGRSQGYGQAIRLSKKNYPFTSQQGPLSARGKLQSHPLAGQAQACGRLHTGGRARGTRWHLSWPLAVTTVFSEKKT